MTTYAPTSYNRHGARLVYELLECEADVPNSRLGVTLTPRQFARVLRVLARAGQDGWPAVYERAWREAASA